MHANHPRPLRRSRALLVAIALAGGLGGLAACGGDDSGDAAAPSTTAATATSMADGAMTDGSTAGGTATTMAGAMSDDMMMGAFGPACSSVPDSGAGSFAGMAADPAATAASNNPVLSTLVGAVQAAGLVDTLNGPGPFTIFAPANDAFEKVDPAALNAALADPSGALTNILTYHVVAGENLDASALAEAGSLQTVQGEELTITGSGQELMVNGAKVLCGNVKTANATVYIIDSVLMP
jgi:uncharacterized surface protein with fasciclin (FAS1) repeats